MSQLLFLGPAGLFLLALFCIWRVKRLDKKYGQKGRRLTNRENEKHKAKEKGWKSSAKLATLACVLPIPFLLLLPIDAAIAFGRTALGTGVLPALFLIGLRLTLKVKFKEVFDAKVGIINEIALLMLGLLTGTLLAVALSLFSNPTLCSAFLRLLLK